jgi:uncharacterized membrane protein
MFHEDEPSRAERAAATVAEHVATWRFAGAVVCALVAWLATNLIWTPFDPHPTVMLASTSAALAALAALQGPLILMSQRRASERDRRRDIETFRVAARTEADLHAVSEQLAAISTQLGASGR